MKAGDWGKLYVSRCSRFGQMDITVFVLDDVHFIGTGCYLGRIQEVYTI